jgi:hypothetical protein
MEGITAKIKDADVLLYEDAGAYQQNVEFYHSVSTNPGQRLEKLLRNATMGKTELGKDKPVKGSHAEPIIRGLYRTRKVAGSIDIGKTEYEQWTAKRIKELLLEPYEQGLDYDESLLRLRNRYAEVTELQNEREDTMIDNFEPVIDAILYSRPDLKEKESLKILVSMGVYHTRLQHEFSRRGMKTKRDFSTPSLYVYDYVTEMQRSLAFGKEPSRELMQRAYAEIILGIGMGLTNKDKTIKDDDRTRYLRKTVSEMSLETIEALYNEWSKNDPTTGDISRLLVDRGHSRLPKSNKDIYETLDGKRKRKGILAKAAIRRHGR